MRSKEFLVAFTLMSVVCVIAQPPFPPRGQQRGGPNLLKKRGQNKPFCDVKTFLFYEDCRICSCQKPGKLALCYPKTCDLRTKGTGYCPRSMLQENQYEHCTDDRVLTNSVGICKTDNDCPGPQLCCFDFCRGATCLDPVPAWDGKPHPGRGYPS